MNKSIKCDVHECINNSKKEGYCKLKNIKVSKSSDSLNKESTICDDYKTKKI